MTAGGFRPARPDGSRSVSVHLVLHGTAVRAWVRRDLLPALRASFPPEVRLRPGPIRGSAWRIDTPADLPGAVQAIELAIAQQAPGLVFVHAGAVAVAGRVLLLPGPSRAGKSTLVDALVRCGAELLSDEFAPVDAQGRVLAYRRPITLRAPAGAASGRSGSPPGSAERPEPAGPWVQGPTPPHPPPHPPPPARAPDREPAALPVALVADLRYRPDATGHWRDQAPGAAMLSLIANTVTAQTRTAEMMAHLAPLVRGARALSGDRREADDAARRLLAELSPGPVLAQHGPDGAGQDGRVEPERAVVDVPQIQPHGLLDR